MPAEAVYGHKIVLLQGLLLPVRKLFAKLAATTDLKGEVTGEQYGTIPYRIVDGRVVFLLITSRRSANWVFPKGSPIKGLDERGTAAQETWEEAGVRGKVAKEPIGSYLNPNNKNENELDRVILYPMEVTEQLDDWPELEERFRHWALLPEARKLLASPAASRLAMQLNRKFLFGDQDGMNALNAK